MTTFLWGTALVVSMLLMAYTAATQEATLGRRGGGPSARPTDD